MAEEAPRLVLAAALTGEAGEGDGLERVRETESQALDVRLLEGPDLEEALAPLAFRESQQIGALGSGEHHVDELPVVDVPQALHVDTAGGLGDHHADETVRVRKVEP